MQQFQKIIIGGHLGGEPERRYTQDGRPMITFSVAVGSRKKIRGTEDWEDVTTWYRATWMGDRASSQMDKMTKGTAVVVDGRLSASVWIPNDDRDPRLSLDVMVNARRPSVLMAMDSTDFDLRCKQCGKDLGSVTVRVRQSREGTDVLGQVRYRVGLVYCQEHRQK